MSKEKFISIIKNTVAVIVIAALFVIIFYQNANRDVLKFGREESNALIENSQEKNDADFLSGSSVMQTGEDSVAFLTSTSLKIYDKKGDYSTVPIALSEPVLHTEGEFILCYSKNSMEAMLYKNDRKYYSVTLENRIVDAKVNKNGYLLVTTEKEGYNCECRVYNRSGEAIFRWDISKSEFIDADINVSNNKIAVSVATAGDKKLLGEVMLIDITDAKVIARKTYDSQLFYSVDFNSNDTFVALGNEKLVYFNNDGTQKWEHNYDGKKLLKAEVKNPDIMTLAFLGEGSIVQGTSTDIVVLNRLGKVVSQKNYSGEIDDISVTESRISMAFGKTIYIVDSMLQEYKNIESEFGVKKLALFGDNKHLYVVGNSENKILS